MKPIKLRRILRRAANEPVGSTVPIELIDGESAPVVRGLSWHYTNKSGDLIYYPNAYRRAWGKPIYNCSTIRVEVGEEWPMHVGLATKILSVADLTD